MDTGRSGSCVIEMDRLDTCVMEVCGCGPFDRLHLAPQHLIFVGNVATPRGKPENIYGKVSRKFQ